MVTKAEIDDFLNQKTLAVVGVSSQGKKFSNSVFNQLKSKGYKVFPVNPKVEMIEGEKCYSSLKDLPEKVDGVVALVPANALHQVAQDAAAAGINQIWIQQGIEPAAAVPFCKEKGIKVIHGLCILMHLPNMGFPHSFHRWLLGAFGRLPR